MTTWASLRTYLSSQYNIASEREGQVALEFPTSNGRSQRVSVDLEVLADKEWVCITSGFGEVGQVDLERALEILNSRIFGAIGRSGNYYVVKHSAPLADMNAEELEFPMHLTLSLADQLEAEVGMGDKF